MKKESGDEAESKSKDSPDEADWGEEEEQGEPTEASKHAEAVRQQAEQNASQARRSQQAQSPGALAKSQVKAPAPQGGKGGSWPYWPQAGGAPPPGPLTAQVQGPPPHAASQDDIAPPPGNFAAPTPRPREPYPSGAVTRDARESRPIAPERPPGDLYGPRDPGPYGHRDPREAPGHHLQKHPPPCRPPHFQSHPAHAAPHPQHPSHHPHPHAPAHPHLPPHHPPSHHPPSHHPHPHQHPHPHPPHPSTPNVHYSTYPTQPPLPPPEKGRQETQNRPLYPATWGPRDREMPSSWPPGPPRPEHQHRHRRRHSTRHRDDRQPGSKRTSRPADRDGQSTVTLKPPPNVVATLPAPERPGYPGREVMPSPWDSVAPRARSNSLESYSYSSQRSCSLDSYSSYSSELPGAKAAPAPGGTSIAAPVVSATVPAAKAAPVQASKEEEYSESSDSSSGIDVQAEQLAPGLQVASNERQADASGQPTGGQNDTGASAQAGRPMRPQSGASPVAQDKQKVPVPAIGTPKQRLVLARSICTLDLRGALSAVKTAATEAHTLGKAHEDDLYLPSLHEEALRNALKDFDVKTRLALRRILRLKAGLTNSQARASAAGAPASREVPASSSAVTPKPVKKAIGTTPKAAAQPNQESAAKSEVRKVRKVVKRRVAEAETETKAQGRPMPSPEDAASVPQRRVTTKGKLMEGDGLSTKRTRSASDDGGPRANPREVRQKASSPSPCSSRSICARQSRSPSLRPRRMQGDRPGRSGSRRRDSRARRRDSRRPQRRSRSRWERRPSRRRTPRRSRSRSPRRTQPRSRSRWRSERDRSRR